MEIDLDSQLEHAVATWGARLIAAGSLLTLIYELACLFFDRRFLSLKNWQILIFHALPIGLYAVAVVMAVRVGPWMRERWRPIALLFSSGIIICSALICTMTREVEPFFVTLVLFLAGTGPFLCWGETYQTWLSLIGISAFVIGTRESSDLSVGPYQWCGLFIATAIGVFSTAFEKRLRRAYRRARDEVLQSRERLIVQERVHIAGELTSGIAHDLNHAVQNIGVHLTLLTSSASTKEEFLTGIAKIQRIVADAYQIVARVRDLSLERNSNQDEPVNVEQVIRDAIEMVASGIAVDSVVSSRDLVIKQLVSNDLPKVRGSAAEIRQVLLNLILNARDAMPTGGCVEVQAQADQNNVDIHVSDEGTGIPPGNLERIFEPFFSTKGANGTGLGLSVSKATIEKYGGTLSATNRLLGGAVFTVSLPIVE